MSAPAEPRRATFAGQLARLGFAAPARAEELLAGVALPDPGGLLDPLAAAADPDAALHGLVRLLGAAAAAGEGPGLVAALRADPGFRDRLVGLLGVSPALGEHLVRHPSGWAGLAGESVVVARPSAAGLRRQLLAAVGADPDDPQPVAGGTGAAALDALRVAYRDALVVLAARDVQGLLRVEEVAGELADLAAAALEAALAVARAGLAPGSPPCRLAVIGMGKCGGRELNYVSDVDVVFVAEPDLAGPGPGDAEAERAALRTATQLASAVVRVCSATTAEGTLWPVDTALRPEGKAGPLVRTLASHTAYYQRWAKTWEFQALLKARPVAGDLELGRAYLAAVGPLVWQAADRPHFVEDVQAMRRRVEDSVPRAEADRQLKLGPGGLRDVEFAVQLLQLVHGRGDPALRSGTTLVALDALRDGGYVGREDGARLAAAYRFLRTLEHRLQLARLRRTHVVPEDPAELRRLGRAMGYRADPVAQLTAEWRRHATEVRRLHEKLFYRPLLAAVARLPGEEARLTPEAARQRLLALGYADPAGALRHLEALTAGVSRRAAIQRTLLPVLLGWFADAADPDAGLLAFRRVSDTLGATPWYLRLLRDEGAAAERMARVLASSRYAADLLLRAPEAVTMLADDGELRPRPGAALQAEVRAAAGRYDDPVAAVAAIRAVRRRELFRLAVADVLGLLDVDAAGAALTDLAVATLSGALDVAVRQVSSEWRGPLPTRLAVVGVGRFGGGELGYGSDADVLFVHEALPGAAEQEAHEAAHAVANELRRLLARPAPDPPLVVDADLRPEGRQGPLVRTLGSYAAYYARWSQVWESQALLRAAPVAGDAELGRAFTALVDPVRWPAGGVDDAQIREIRRIKARVEAERLPRGADPSTHLKLGRGGLADVEWTVQLLQLRHAHRVPGLRVTGTLPALAAAAAAGLVDPADAGVLTEAWRLAARLRNATVLVRGLVRGRSADAIPVDPRERAGVARLVGYPPAQTGELIEDYRRVTRRARRVVERVFYE